MRTQIISRLLTRDSTVETKCGLKLTDIVKKAAIPALALGLLCNPVKSKGNVITQYDPIYDTGADRVQLYTDFTNDDSGAVYDSYETEIFRDLVTSLWANPENQTTYGIVANMLGAWTLDISSAGDVQNGWTHDSNYSDLNITHGPFGYDSWTSDSSSDMMRLTLNIPLSQLDGDGDGWSSSDLDDYVIGQGASESGMGVAHEGITSYSADGNPYVARQIPEPATMSLLGLGALGLVYLKRKRREKG